MIKLFEFAKKAAFKKLFESEASEEAHKLGLHSRGWGRWYDTNGAYVAKTVDDKLVKVDDKDKMDNYKHTSTRDMNPKERPDDAEWWSGDSHMTPQKSWEIRKPAVTSFIEKNGGLFNTYQLVTAAAKNAMKLDESERWKALKLARQFKHDVDYFTSEEDKRFVQEIDQRQINLPSNVETLVNIEDVVNQAVETFNKTRPHSKIEYDDVIYDIPTEMWIERYETLNGMSQSGWDVTDEWNRAAGETALAMLKFVDEHLKNYDDNYEPSDARLQSFNNSGNDEFDPDMRNKTQRLK